MHARKHLAREPGDPGFPARQDGDGAQWEVGGHTPLMHEPGKSDRRVVPEKVPNKARRRAAEGLEGRRLAKGSSQATTLRTQGRVRVHAALGRVRKAAQAKKGVRFTALLHHIYAIDTLRAAFHSLERDAAPGVDGETWNYNEDLEAHLAELWIGSGEVRTAHSRYDGCSSQSGMVSSVRLA